MVEESGILGRGFILILQANFRSNSLLESGGSAFDSIHLNRDYSNVIFSKADLHYFHNDRAATNKSKFITIQRFEQWAIYLQENVKLASCVSLRPKIYN